MFPQLETERLELREITEEDAEDIFACFSNELVTRYYGQEPLTRLDQAREFVEFFSKIYAEKRGIRWGIKRKGTNHLIGTIGFNLWLPKHHRAEIGYEIHPNYWRNGYAREAIAKLISFGFEELDLTRIGAVVFLKNEASNQLLLNLGFKKEGILRAYMYQNGVPNDVNVYSIVKTDS